MYKLDECDAHNAEDLRALGWDVEIRFSEHDDELPNVDDAETFDQDHWS